MAFVVAGDEPAAEAKQVAVDVVTALGTYPEGDGNAEAAMVRAGPRLAPDALPPVVPLLARGRSAIDVVYPQLGGLTATDTSVMVVARHRLLVDGRVSSVVRTIDVRLRLDPGGPVVVGFGSFGGEPVEGPAPGPLAGEVLASDRIVLPDSARFDVLAGRVEDQILRLLLDLSVDYRLSVTVFASGHPTNVFATEHVSNHTEGRGVDIWAIDGRSVLSLRGAGVLEDLVEQVLAAGVTEVGSPVDVDGHGGPSFTNTVHQDHLHLAYDG